MLSLLLSATLAATPASAVPSPVATVPPVVTTPVATVPPTVAAPAPMSVPPVDPARLIIARTTAGALFSDGTMARMLDRMLSNAPGSYASWVLDMTPADFMAMVPPGTFPATPPKDSPEMHTTFRQMAAKGDPLFDQRFSAIHDAVVAEAARLGPSFEPQLRDGLATSLARRFTAPQLTDMNRFFLTESGRAFAEERYLMWLDPAVFKSMMSAMPALIKEFPASAQRVKAAVDRFPWPKKVTTPEAAPKKPVPKKAPPRRKK